MKDATAGNLAACIAPGFNPRVREGRDRFSVTPQTIFCSFNPRVREGRDRGVQPVRSRYWVSIHASVKDATDRLERMAVLYAFQSTRP